MDVVSVADLDPVTGAVSGFRQGTLAGPTVITRWPCSAIVSTWRAAGARGRAFAADVVSYPINADGTPGALRGAQASVAARLSWALRGRRAPPHRGGRIERRSLLHARVARGRLRRCGRGGGRRGHGPWASIDAPFGESYSGDVGVAGGTLFFFDTGTYNDRSSRALYGIRLSSVEAGAPPRRSSANTAWPFDPSALGERDRRAGGTMRRFPRRRHGRVATAPVDGRSRRRLRRAARFEGSQGGWAIASSPSGRVYVTGGFASSSADARARRLHAARSDRARHGGCSTAGTMSTKSRARSSAVIPELTQEREALEPSALRSSTSSRSECSSDPDVPRAAARRRPPDQVTRRASVTGVSWRIVALPRAREIEEVLRESAVRFPTYPQIPGTPSRRRRSPLRSSHALPLASARASGCRRS